MAGCRECARQPPLLLHQPSERYNFQHQCFQVSRHASVTALFIQTVLHYFPSPAAADPRSTVGLVCKPLGGTENLERECEGKLIL